MTFLFCCPLKNLGIDSAGKGTCHQTSQPEVNLQGMHDGRREPTLTRCLLTSHIYQWSTWVRMFADTQTVTSTKNERTIFFYFPSSFSQLPCVIYKTTTC